MSNAEPKPEATEPELPPSDPPRPNLAFLIVSALLVLGWISFLFAMAVWY